MGLIEINTDFLIKISKIAVFMVFNLETVTLSMKTETFDSCRRSMPNKFVLISA